MASGLIIINNEIIFDASSFELKPLGNSGEAVVLNAPTSRCLQLLIEKKDEVVSRDDFLEQVWLTRGIVVSQNTFYQNISLLRKSLKICGLTDDIIITVRRKGFTLAPETQLQRLDEDKAGAPVVTGSISIFNEQRKPTPETGGAITGVQNVQVNQTSSDSLLKVARWLVLLLIFLIILEVVFFMVGN